MLTVRQTAKWMFVLLLLGGGAAGAYAYHLWNHSDEMLREIVQKKLAEQLPGWTFRIERCRFDLTGRIRLYNVELLVSEEEPPVAAIPEIVITVDRTQLATGNPSLRHLRFVRPKLLAVRYADGTWNFERLPPMPPVADSVPEMQLDEGELTVERQDIEPFASASVTAIFARIVPAARRDVNFELTAKPPHAEGIAANGHVHLDGKTWSLNSKLTKIECSDGLIALARKISPEFRGISDRWQIVGTQTEGVVLPLSPAGKSEADPFVHEQALAPQAGPITVNALADFTFDIRRDAQSTSPDYHLAIDLLGGTVTHAGYVVSLSNLGGRVRLTSGEMVLEKLGGRYGNGEVRVDGKLAIPLDAEEFRIDSAGLTLELRKLPLDERTRSMLTGKLREIYDDLQPEGLADVSLVLDKQNGKWTAQGDLVTREAAVTHVRFPYRCDHVAGKVSFARDSISFAFQGKAGTHPISLTGRVDAPGPEAEVAIDIRVPDIRYDERLHAALPPKVQGVIEQLDVTGRLGGYVRLTRPRGLGRKFSQYLNAKVTGGTARPKCFPYHISEITGLLEGGGESWSFSGFRGRHEQAEVTVDGTFRPDRAGVARLVLDIGLANSSFDADLSAALPPRWQGLWQELNVRGQLAARSHVEWTPGGVPDVQLPELIIRDGSMELRSFPYPFDDVQARVAFRDGTVTISDFSGRHEETLVRTQGIGRFEPNGEWRMRLENLRVDDLDPDRRFRKTLPTRLREIVDTIDPRKGKISLAGMLEFRGTGVTTDPVSAAWDLETIYSGASVSTGIDLDNLQGVIATRGTWDGEMVDASGQIALDSLTFKGHQLTQIRGPIKITGTQLILGHKLAVDGVTDAERPEAGDRSKRLTANFIGGTIILDSIAVLEQKTSYRVRLLLESGKLENYARLYLPGRNKLMGMMNGWLDLSGTGTNSQRLTGRGQLLIAPAALYELPVVLAIFRTVFQGTPDTTAFRNAFFEFDVGGGQFQFRKIDLIGDSVSLRGHGYVRFDGPLSLDFYSTAGRNQVPIPLLRDVLRESTSGMWGVHVRGTLTDPKADVEAAPRFNNALRQFLGVMDGRPGARMGPPAANARPEPRQANR